MTRLLWLFALAAAPHALGDEPLSVRVHVGGQVGFPHLLGVEALGSLRVGDQPRLDVDLLWEPSNYLQSYSLGVAWRPLGVLAVGPRLRAVQFAAPWSRSAAATNRTFVGLGLEAGVRVPIATRGLLSVSLGATFVPAQASNLQLLIGLTAGFAWGIADFGL